MVGRYGVYPMYKASGIGLLGSIPEDWNVMQLKRTVEGCINGIWGAEPQENGDDTIVIRVADFERSKLYLKDDGYTCRRIEKKEKENRALRYGDLLLEKSGGGEKTLVGQVVIFNREFDAVTSNFVAKMSPLKEFDSRFLNYVFCRFYQLKINYCSIKQNTGIQNLDSESYLAEKFGFPGINEQAQIANFLDHETAKIDILIDKQQQLIVLLKEKRQAVISHAVTKGINPDAPMKDSGVEWLGEVPEHWITSKIGYCAVVSNGATPSRENPAYWENGSVGWLNSSKVNDVFIYDAEQFITDLAVKQTSVRVINKNDLVMAITGEGQTRGRIAVSNITGTINQHLASISISVTSLNHMYLFYWLTSQYDRIRFESSGAGSTKGAITCSDIIKYPTPIPPLQEQREFVDYLDSCSQYFDALNKKSAEAVSLLQERRTALIAAAVTGKIDVRNWQSPTKTTANKDTP